MFYFSNFLTSNNLVSNSHSDHCVVEASGLLCDSCDNPVLVFQHSNVHQPSGNNIIQGYIIVHIISQIPCILHTLHTKYSHTDNELCSLKTTILHSPLPSFLLTGIYLLNRLCRYPNPSPTKMK